MQRLPAATSRSHGVLECPTQKHVPQIAGGITHHADINSSFALLLLTVVTSSNTTNKWHTQSIERAFSDSVQWREP